MIFLGRHRGLMREAAELIEAQRDLIESLYARIMLQDLHHVRATRDLVEQFLIAHESGADVRDDLLAGLRDLSDHVARLEEHVS